MDIPRLKDRHRLKSQPPNMTFLKAKQRGTKLTFYHSLKMASNWFLKAKQRGTKLTFYHSLKGASNWTSRGLKIDTV